MRKTVLTILFAALLPLGLMAQITEPGATSPNQLYTTTYDNPGGPNHGPNRAGENGGSGFVDPNNPGYVDPNDPPEPTPVGAPWALLAFAAAYGAFRLIRRRG